MPIDLDKIAKMHEADREIIRKKNASYGNNNIRLTGAGGLLTRILDKASRAVNISQNPGLDQFGEALEDTLGDLSNYGVLGRMLLNGDLYERPNSVYLAGPVDMIEDPNGVEAHWRSVVKDVFHRYRIATFDPAAAWLGGTFNDEVKKQVMDVDFNVVSRVGMMFAYLPSKVPSFGTIREIERARSLGKRVVVVSDWAGGSAFSVDVEVYPEFEDAIAAVLQENPFVIEEKGKDGPERVDNSEPRTYSIGKDRVPMPKTEPAR